MAPRRKGEVWTPDGSPAPPSSARPIVVGVVASERAWRAEFVSYVHNHVGDLRLRVLREPRAAFAPDVDTVVGDDSSTLLAPRTVRDLQAAGKRVLGVFDDESEGAGEALLEKVGVDLRVSADTAPDEMARLILALGPAERLDAELDEFLGVDGATPPPEPSHPLGVAVAVGGPHGAGATEVALGLAAAQVRRRARVLVVDLDLLYPGVARRLRYAMDPNLLATLDAITYEGRPLDVALAARAEGAPGVVPFDAVGGLANPADWLEVSEEDVAVLLDDAQSGWPCVVVDIGGGLEAMEVEGRERFGAARVAVARADAVVAVGEASRLGLLRLLDWAAAAHGLAPERLVHVALNRAPRSEARRRELGIELEEALGPLLGEVVFVGVDEAVGAAAWDGRPVGRGPFSRAMRRLGAAVNATVATSSAGAHR